MKAVKIGIISPTLLAVCISLQGQTQKSSTSGSCRQVVFDGEVEAGHMWSQSLGRGWAFKILPIRAGEDKYSGWDLAVGPISRVGYPDALLLATPPYGAINQREIGTTFGLRAQDAIGWNPRSFHFLTNVADMRKAQKLYFELRTGVGSKLHRENAKYSSATSEPSSNTEALSKALMDIAHHSATGQFRIIDARLTPGTANALPYAQNWALQQRNTPHDNIATTTPTPYGKLYSIKFEITLWLPASWKLPKKIQSSPSSCQ